ncbi:type I pullulanase [Marinicrinis sediminis]|uniref:pullulanase n=1 Tax=Marinicrinis sediminis TaxID=1652465 RepID=A0ABW5R7W0_9BACL
MRKKWIAMLAALMMLMSVISPSPVLQTVSAEAQTQVTIHYQAAEGSTQDWNLWVWPKGGDGAAYPFTGTDAFGQVAEITLNGDHTSVGFIVRTDDWEKDIDEDRFIEDILGGEAEIWLIGGDSTVYTSEQGKPKEEQRFDEVEVTVHYYRYDQNYEGWNLWAWPEGKDGASYSFSEQDDFGAVARFTLTGMQDASQIGFIVRQSTADNEWNDREFGDRFISKIKEDGTAEIWLAQNQERVHYKESQVDRSPRIMSAELDEIDTLTIETNIPFKPTDGDMGFSLKSEQASPAILKVTPLDLSEDGYMRNAEIQLKDPVDLNQFYTLYKEGYIEASLTMGDIFSSQSFEDIMTYEGEDLGAVYTKNETRFRVWAPTAREAKLVTYDSWDTENGTELDMQRDANGTWIAKLDGDQDGTIYTYKVLIGDSWNEAVDPYARTVTVNGDRGVVVDLDKTNPDDWKPDSKPAFEHAVDAIIYELHVRDLSMHPESGITHKGKFLGLTEKGTTGPNGTKTGLDHILDLGVTHVQILPFYDYASVDETKLDTPQFNWGYDPKNYNAPEGSYATDPYNPYTRITELKKTIQTLHDHDLRLIMDVVYNHVFAVNTSSLHQLVPGYYFRYTEDGQLVNGSGVGNDTASERKMMRKLIVDSVVYWAKEYNIDGFRFDLMGIHDIDTMNEVRAALDEIDPSIITIGEGWDLGTQLDAGEKANQNNASQLPGIGQFNDSTRDGIKGSVFNQNEPGWVNGKYQDSYLIKGAAAGGVFYNSLIQHYAVEPDQSVNYVEAHDNNTLWDKLTFTNPDASDEEKESMHKLASAIVLTSQGISFLHAGQEFMRTKGGDENSYRSPDSVNQLDWVRKDQYQHVVDYFKGMIELRKSHPAFRMTSAEDIQEHIAFIDTPSEVVAYTINDHANQDSWETIAVVYNADKNNQQVTLPKDGSWHVVLNGEQAGTQPITTLEGNQIDVPARSAMVLYQGENNGLAAEGDEEDLAAASSNSQTLIWSLAAALLVILAAGAFFLWKRKQSSSTSV